MSLVIYQNILAAELTQDVSLSIILHNDEKSPLLTENLDEEWDKVCNSWGQVLKADANKNNWGLFPSYKCHQENKNKKLVEASEWKLYFEASKRSLKINLQYKQHTYKEIALPSHELMLRILQNKKIIEIVSLGFIETLPMLMLVTPEMLWRKEIIRNSPGSHITNDWVPPEKLILYKLSKDQKTNLLKANVIGKTESFKEIENKNKNKQLVWKVNLEKFAGENDTIWAHNLKGPGRIYEDFEDAFEEVFDDVADIEEEKRDKEIELEEQKKKKKEEKKKYEIC